EVVRQAALESERRHLGLLAGEAQALVGDLERAHQALKLARGTPRLVPDPHAERLRLAPLAVTLDERVVELRGELGAVAGQRDREERVELEVLELEAGAEVLGGLAPGERQVHVELREQLVARRRERVLRLRRGGLGGGQLRALAQRRLDGFLRLD